MSSINILVVQSGTPGDGTVAEYLVQETPIETGTPEFPIEGEVSNEAAFSIAQHHVEGHEPAPCSKHLEVKIG